MSKAVTPGRRLFSELRRRRLFRTAALYIVGTWLVLQVADVVLPAMDIPEQAIRYLLVAALLGFPVVLVFSWFYDVGLQGIRRTGPAGAEESAAVQPLRRSDYLILTAFAGVAAVILYGAVGSVIESPREIRETPREGPPMVAVLPFVSKSLKGDSEFFANGVHDDLLTQLAQLQSIRVISRTSVLEYRDTVRNIREIGKELGADAILEGSVQSAGGKIRINAQLIDARTDEHLWAQTYDRDLSPANIFEVQTEIARAITSALRATLTVQEATQVTVIPTENMAAYRAYHRALEIRDSKGYPEWIPLFRQALEEAVALDPSFTRAWAELAGILSFESFGQEDPEVIQRAEQILDQIRTLAPKSADYLIAQAYYTYYVLKNYDRAHQLISQAQDMMPSDARLVELKSLIQRRQGDFEGMVESLRLARTLDPRNPRWTDGLVHNLVVSHRYDDARMEIENSSFQIYKVSYWDSVLLFREHRDLGRWADGLVALQMDFEDEADPVDLWSARIANRDYAAAEESLSAFQGPDETGTNKLGVLSNKEWSQIVTYWFMQPSDRLPEVLAQARSNFDESRNAGVDFDFFGVILDMALVAAAEGNTEEAKRLIRRWRRKITKDLAELAKFRHISCRVLGMAGATAATVDCIRDGLKEPSYVMPFMEPYLPYYDSMRDEPKFVELLADLGDAANRP